MKLDKSIYQDAECIGVDMKQLVNLMNIVIEDFEDFEDNGELEDRRALTASALYIVKAHLEMLADMQGEIVDRMAAEVPV